MDPVEWSQVKAAVVVAAPRLLLEWGAGGSTAEFSRLAGQVHTIEHDREWAARAEQNLPAGAKNVAIRCVRANEPEPAPDDWDWRMRAEQVPEVMADYVAAPGQMGLEPDVVFVDGRARRFCIREGFRLLRPGGLLILHDAQRTYYHDALPGNAVFLEPWRQGQVCLARKD